MGGWGVVSVGTRAIVLHEVTGRSDPKKKINEETALLPPTLFLPARILWEESGYRRAPNGRIINMTDRGMRKEDGGERAGEILLVGNVRRAGVFSRQHSAEFYPLHESAMARAFFSIHIFSSQEQRRKFPSTRWWVPHTRWCPACMSFIRNLGGAALMFPFLCFLSVADITD